MNNKEKYQKWLQTAQYDLDTADAMYNNGRYIYVAFMCQQAIEKLAKGIYVYNFDKEAKYTHNIAIVLEDIEGIRNSKEYEKYKTLFGDLTAYYISGRYSAYKEEISKDLDNVKAEALLSKSKEAFRWLKSQVKL